MRTAIIAPCWFPVPPTGYGGVEWVVSLLADGLVDGGHDVTLFASGDSHTKAKLEAVFAVAPSEWIGRSFWELRHILHCYERADDFDVINDHSGPVAATLISLSMNQRKPRPDYNWIANCPNALDLSVYPFRPQRGEYLLFLGRMSPDKGAHRAVAVAMETGLPLKIAGKMREPKERQYFAEFVEPHLGNGIEWLGEVSHGEKVELLQHARVTLFPIEWEEPFGLVMIESMACGTPVIATARGAVPEVIEQGRSGIIVEDYRVIPAALEAADRLDSRDIRSYVEERFSPMRMVRDYSKAYELAIERAHA
jgi:glycosyltransferase involved in cell wall biosynthesis